MDIEHYDAQERVELLPYQIPAFPNDSACLRRWVERFWKPGQVIETYTLLDTTNRAVHEDIPYSMREEPGVQSPAATLERDRGSWQDRAPLTAA